MAMGISQISSRRRVPLSAFSKSPGNVVFSGPFYSIPNKTFSSVSAVSKAQLTLTNGPFLRLDWA
jgi:hypothetical protein